MEYYKVLEVLNCNKLECVKCEHLIPQSLTYIETYIHHTKDHCGGQ